MHNLWMHNYMHKRHNIVSTQPIDFKLFLNDTRLDITIKSGTLFDFPQLTSHIPIPKI